MMEIENSSDIEGFILAGGASSRMGTDKAHLQLGGRDFVERIAAALAAVAQRISIVVNEQSRAETHTRFAVVPDVYENWGALGGLHAALANCRTSWAAIVACDLPFVTRELFTRLVSLRDKYEAVAPLQSEDARPQPLCALYRTIPARLRAQTLISSGERRAHMLLRALHTRFISQEELADINGAPFLFTNVNTPEDYERAKELLSTCTSQEIVAKSPKASFLSPDS
jgi:molybdopterin-guanine dinucleotide biosynthesis protein A